MASEWARKKAEELLASSFVEHIEECQHGMWDEPGCTCGHEDLRDAIAAALDEAQERGGKEALVKAVPLKELMSEALAEAREEAEANAALIARAPELLAENEELMEAHQALGHEYEMLARERDKLQALVGKLLSFEPIPFDGQAEMGYKLGLELAASELAAILDETEPKPLKLGHEFVPYRGYFVESKVCIFLGCGQPREAH